MGWLTNAIPDLGTANTIGALRGENQGLREAVAEWREYAQKLERQVKFYRADAINGWAMAKACNQIVKEKFGVDMKEEFIDELKQKQENNKKDIAKLVDEEAAQKTQ